MHEWLTEQWQSMSNGQGAGVIKRYISKRFGVQTQFHSKYLDENAKLTAEFNRLVAGFMRDKGMTFSQLDEYFDLMRQFNANLVERFGFLNKDGTITLYRGIHGSYFRDAGLSVPRVGDSGVMAANSAESWSTSITAAKGFTGTDGVIISATFKADDILFSPFGWDDIRYASESEFVIGGMKEVSYKAVWQK